MTNHDLAQALVATKTLEAEARQHWTDCTRRQDLAEADAALNMLRHITASRKSLEGWIAIRAVRESRRIAS